MLRNAGKRSFDNDNDDGKQLSFKKTRADFKLRQLKGNPIQNRRTNDEIHKSIDFCPVMTALIDTPQFQRLRGIKQLGTAEYVYSNANHNRFEHSLGVADLARRMCERIHTRQPQLPCTEKDQLCIKLAGLLHDIGHGPFSHIFEGFLLHACPAYLKENPHLEKYYKAEESPKIDAKVWCHEEVSLKMIDAALAHIGLAIDLDNLDAPLKQIGDGVDATTMRVFNSGLSDEEAILTSRDFVFIKECIYGKPLAQIENNHPAVQHLVGRTDIFKEWMYDIVSNKHSGLDVDKVDYFARDTRRAYGHSGDVHIRMILDCFVAWGECSKPNGCSRCLSREFKKGKHLMICYPSKIDKSAIGFFKERLDLHEAIYRHKTVQASSFMIHDILCLADPFFKIPLRDEFDDEKRSGQPKEENPTEQLHISSAVLDMRAFQRLQDSVIDQIACTTQDELKEARRLIRRLRSRDLYKCVGSKHISLNDESDKNIWKDHSEESIKEDLLKLHAIHGDGISQSITLEPSDIIVEKCHIHHGSKDRNPLKRMRFIEKKDGELLRNEFHLLPDGVSFDKAR